jgi:hypothetical protein
MFGVSGTARILKRTRVAVHGWIAESGGAMRTRILSVAVAACFVGSVAASVAAQTDTRTHDEITTKQTGPAGTSKVRTETVTGIVKEYEAGKKIKISGPDDKTYSFDLGENARVEGAIVVGQKAKVEFTKSKDGGKSVEVVSEASREDVKAASEPRTHMESTMKEQGPNGSSKVKTEVVIGTVKTYEAGKKITVTGPKNKNYSFDLDEQVTIAGPVSIGDRVKVTLTKGDNGERVTVLAPYKGKA